jgi:hypothetical protein
MTATRRRLAIDVAGYGAPIGAERAGRAEAPSRAGSSRASPCTIAS